MDERTVRTAREVISHSTDMVNWTNEPGFDRDVFTFAPVIYSFGLAGSNPRISPTSSPWGWIRDFPDSDRWCKRRFRESVRNAGSRIGHRFIVSMHDKNDFDLSHECP